MDFTEKKIRELNRYEGLILDVHVDSVSLPNGSVAKREIVDHPGGVTILPMDADGNVYCVRQYRYAFSTEMLEVPAGKLEPGEEPLSAALRELSEETGIAAGRIDFLGSFPMSPGFCTEVLHLYLARELSFGEAHLDVDELLDVETHTLAELLDMVMRGEVTDAKTVIAVLMAARLIEQEKHAEA